MKVEMLVYLMCGRKTKGRGYLRYFVDDYKYQISNIKDFTEFEVKISF